MTHMSVKRTSLGRNLSALLSQSSTLLQEEEPTTPEDSSFSRLNIDCLQPSLYQPRRDMAPLALEELAASIKQQGILQPLVVRQINPDSYEILAGERRWRAAQLAGLTEIPVMIKAVDDESAMAIALIENLQREDLNALDQAYAMHRLISEFDLTHQQVADILGKSRAAVSNHLRLLSLSDTVKRLLENEDLDMGHARALLTLAPEQQAEVAAIIVAKALSVRETEQLIQRLSKKTTERLKPSAEISTVPYAELFHQHLQQLAQQLKAKVQIQQKQSGKGSVVIHFDSQASLEKIMEKIARVDNE
jgi:ParB family chromosome partitioning protein